MEGKPPTFRIQIETGPVAMTEHGFGPVFVPKMAPIFRALTDMGSEPTKSTRV